ncbi:MAG: mechanosensitive ion channel family protein [Fuerstiella sp.]
MAAGPIAAVGQDDAESTDAEAAGDSSMPVDDPMPTVNVNRVTADEAIQSRISRILNASRSFQEVEVRVDEGLVFVEGVANQPTDVEWATSVSRRVEDVVAVINNMTVQEVVTLDVDKSSMHVRDSLRALWRDFLERLPLILVGVVILLLTWGFEKLANAIVRRSVARARLRPSLGDLMVQLSTFFTWLIGVMVAAIVVFPGMTPAKLLTVLGLSSVALGFAFKDIFENFFAGILILWRFPFDKGDFVECNGLCGKVEDITIRMSLIRQVDGQLVVIPNAMLFKNPVNVITSQSLRRTTVICGVAYSEDVDQSRTVIEGAVRECPTVADSKPVEIFAQEFADSSINFEVTWWTGSTPLEIRRSRDEVVATVKRALDEAGIEIPFPYRTLTFKESLPLSGSVQGLAHDTSAER